MPKLKVEQKDSVAGEGIGVRSYQEMLDLISKEKLDSKTLNEKEVRILIDCLGHNDETAKILAEGVKKGKAVLLSYAEAHKMYEIIAGLWFAKASDSTDFDLPASRAIKILEKEGKTKLLDSVLKVSIGDFRKYLGSDLFEKNASREKRVFSAISLKRIKKIEENKAE